MTRLSLAFHVLIDMHCRPLEAVEAVMRATKGRGRFSAHLLKIVIIQYYEKHKLFPKGMVGSMECVQTWALKMGLALQRLASWQQSALCDDAFMLQCMIHLHLPFQEKTYHLRSAGFGDLCSDPKVLSSKRPRSSRMHCETSVHLGCIYPLPFICPFCNIA